nr:hypothetical protein [bacterium]
MDILIGPDTRWYHGSNKRFDTLLAGSTITPVRALAEAFSHQPTILSMGEDAIVHDGAEPGFLYAIEQALVIGRDIQAHPHTTMDKHAEFLTTRPLKVRLLCQLPPPSREQALAARAQLRAMSSSMEDGHEN